MRAGWFFLVWAACRHTAPTGFDNNLPEEASDVELQAPRALVEAEAGELNPSIRAVALDMVLLLDWGPEWDARALGDPSGWVQQAAVRRLLLRSDDPLVRERLVTFIEQTDRDAMARATAGLNVPGSDVAAAVERAWQVEPVAWRRIPLALAALVRGAESALEPLAREIRSGELPLEPELLHAIGNSGQRDLVQPLQQAQTLVDPELELAVAAARWRLGDGTAEEPFRKALTGRDVEKRMEALDYLVQLDREQVKGLLMKARTQGPELVTWYADLALAAHGGTDPGLFEEGAKHADREVRELAVRFADEIATRAEPSRRLARVARSILIDSVTDEHPTVRRTALAAVRKLRLLDSMDAVKGLLGDDNRMVRLEASGTLLVLEAPLK